LRLVGSVIPDQTLLNSGGRDLVLLNTIIEPTSHELTLSLDEFTERYLIRPKWHHRAIPLHLELPVGLEDAAVVVKDGVQSRVLRAYDITQDKMIIRIDVLYREG
jgi:hypothetical protein